MIIKQRVLRHGSEYIRISGIVNSCLYCENSIWAGPMFGSIICEDCFYIAKHLTRPSNTATYKYKYNGRKKICI